MHDHIPPTTQAASAETISNWFDELAEVAHAIVEDSCSRGSPDRVKLSNSLAIASCAVAMRLRSRATCTQKCSTASCHLSPGHFYRLSGLGLNGRQLALGTALDIAESLVIERAASSVGSSAGEITRRFTGSVMSFMIPDDKWPDGRVGVMLVERAGGFADVFGVGASAATGQFGTARVGRIALSDELKKIAVTFDGARTYENESRYIQLDHNPADPKNKHYSLAWQIYVYLLLINTPHVTSRAQHDPHRALAREVLAKRKLLGVFPLQAWTEITLKPGAVDSEERPDTITGTTGTVALHWTRAHRRRIQGVWTLISDYWSGDGSLGIKQSRYKVVPGAERRAP
jgi:hypothetical protein